MVLNDVCFSVSRLEMDVGVSRLASRLILFHISSLHFVFRIYVNKFIDSVIEIGLSASLPRVLSRDKNGRPRLRGVVRVLHLAHRLARARRGLHAETKTRCSMRSPFEIELCVQLIFRG